MRHEWKHLASLLAAFVAHLGAAGLILLGILDSSFLILPFGNDLMMVALTSRHPRSMLLYAGAATLGSTLGCLLLDLVARKGGEVGLRKLLSGRQLKMVTQKVRTRAGWVLSVASLLPPPFPFSAFVAGAAAFGYPRAKLLGVVAACRLLRFLTLGWLARHFGRRFLEFEKSPLFEWLIAAIVLISVAGTALSLYSWVRRSRAAASATA